MELKLRYNQSLSHSANAAIVRGNSPNVWLKEINHWNIPLNQLECYLLPKSIKDLNPAGLFIILPEEKNLFDRLLDPYTKVAGKLFIPVHSTLFPEVTEKKLQHLLLYDVQVFHPLIGLVGYERTDKLNLVDLLDFSFPVKEKWGYAHPGLPKQKRLEEIHIEQPTVQELLDSVKKSIDTKPLEEIPGKDKKDSPLNKFLDPIKTVILKTGLFFIRIVPATSHSSTPGILNHLEDWLSQNLEDLQKKRNKELNRLLELFNKNSNEALRYAIPLDSPYLNRGTSVPSSRLSRQSVNFDLRRLGGGTAIDAWDVSYYYNDLRSKYLQATQREIDLKDYKKAAYIYAHLLGDYHSAAKVLEQGKFYREAAVLYKDHIKNLPAAAECLERGGLYLEAITIYTELHKYEKSGDLYNLIGQKNNSLKYYEKTIDNYLNLGDYIEASRIISDKLYEQERAKNLLLKGWNQSNQQETCLKKYFDVISEEEDQSLSQEVNRIYTHQTQLSQRTVFLNVLTMLIRKNREENLLKESREIAYKIISQQIKEGNTNNLHSLKNFFPEDKLIASDCSRYVSNHGRIKSTNNLSQAFQLDSSIHWITAIEHRNQFLALGFKHSALQLVRGNWYGNFEYHSWPIYLEKEIFSLVTESYNTNQILIRSSGIGLEEKQLAQDKYFDEQLIVKCPGWLAKGYHGVTFKPDGKIIVLKTSATSMTLHECDPSGNLSNSIHCKFDSDTQFLMSPSKSGAELIFRNGYYFTYKGNFLIRISERGYAERFNTHSYINKIAASVNLEKMHVAVATDKGCWIYKGERDFQTESPIFISEIRSTDMKFISSNLFAITDRKKVYVYQIFGQSANLLKTYEALRTVISILPTSYRNKVAFLEDSGRINIYELEIES